MTLRFSLYSLYFPILFLMMGGTLAIAVSSFAGDPAHNLPINSIGISFDPANGSMSGTSRITLPPETPLTLYCGRLEITGAVLEAEGQTPRILKPETGNTIAVPGVHGKQSVYISWKLIAAGNDDNLISERGITLAGLWHPLPDIDMAYRLEAGLPKGFTAVSEGEILTYCLDRTGNRYLTTVFDHPVRSIHFAAGPYTVKSRELPGGMKLSAFFFAEDIALADGYLDKAQHYLKLYQEMIGPYPYNRYSIVENRLPTGYGMPTFTLLGQAVVRLPFIKDTSLGHEILHSWFGNSVMTSETGGNWSEGLTSYLADHYYDEQKGEGAASRKNLLLRYGSYVTGKNEITLQQFTSPAHSQPMARRVRSIGYDKAGMVFHMLRRQLGDDLFFQALKKFYLQYRFKRAGWNAIEQIFTSVSGHDMSSFFEQWLTRGDILKLGLDHVDVSQEKGQSVIRFTLQQKTARPYSFQLPVVVRTGREEVRQSIAITEQNQPIEITVDDLPVELIIDPDYDLMRMISTREKPSIWSQFIGAGDKIAVLPTSDREQDIYAPLLPVLEGLGCELVPADELDNGDLDQGSFLFLGNSVHSLGLFADPAHFDRGVTVDIRENPLAPGQTAVLLTSADSSETRAVASKLSHYGKYSFLYFENGQIVKKTVAPSEEGIRISLFSQPKALRVSDIRSLEEIIEEVKNDRVVYVGEMHTDLGSHLLQLQVIQALYREHPDLAIGMEMFPATSQEALDQYINGTIPTEREFIKKSNYFSVWGFDYRYYRDIIGFAHRNKIPIIGLNIDKAIVSKVFKEGNLDGLDADQSKVIPVERQLDAPGYRQRLLTAFSSHDRNGMDPAKIGGFIQAQSIWDETMADTIADYLSANPEKKMVVIAGNGHVYKESAIPARVARRMDVHQSVISSVNFGTTGLERGYKVDYLVYTSSVELEPAPKIGVVLDKEQIEKGAEKTRLRVTRISPHGRAGEAGVHKNDIILSLDGQKVEDIGDIRITLMDKRPGDTVSLKVLREHALMADEELELKVELSAPMKAGAMPLSHQK